MQIKKLALVAMILIQNAFCLPEETLSRLKRLYPNQTEAFLEQRLSEAKTGLALWRSFPPYYYDLIKRSEKDLGPNFLERKGLCAGDSHFENFGFLFLGTPFFSVNDLDDVALCPLNVDALRLYISHLFLAPVDSSKWMESYRQGLAGQEMKLPVFLQELESQSLKEGKTLPKKLKKLLSDGCAGEFAPVSKDEIQPLKDYLKSEGKILYSQCQRMKESGGSAGLKRYVLFYKQDKQFFAFELKPLINPAPEWESIIDMEIRKKLFGNAVNVFLGPAFEQHYLAVKMNDLLYQRRPLFSGNKGLAVGAVPKDQLEDVMLYQAFTLGSKHRGTNAEMISYDPSSWEIWGKKIQSQWLNEFTNK